VTAERKRERLFRIEEIVQEHKLTKRQVVRRCTTRGVKLQQDPDVQRSCLTMISESDLREILREPTR
jgi:hypothetical protein